MIILERHSVVTSLSIKDSPEITKNKSIVAQIIPSPVEVRPYLVRGSYLYRGSYLDTGPDPDLMNNIRTWTSNCTHSLKGMQLLINAFTSTVVYLNHYWITAMVA